MMAEKNSKTSAKTQRGCPPTEFGGPIGVLGTIVALPILVLVLAHWANTGYLDLDFGAIFAETQTLLFDDSNDDSIHILVKCALGLLGWFFGLVALWFVLPGRWVDGAPVIDPELPIDSSSSKEKPVLRLKYKLNGHLTFWVVAILLAVTKFPLNDYLYQNYERLAFVDIVLCFALSVWLYAGSFAEGKDGKKRILSHTGRSGNLIYDFFMGRELNPRSLSGSFDWKQFCELRPGLMLWVLLNIACAQEQYRTTGSVSGSMALLNLFHAVYVWDSLYMERAILTTMDITTDGFGFMLVFGDLAWVPFTYNHPAKYLVRHDPNLSRSALALIFGLYVAGYWVFRLSNRQKDIFRSDPNDPRVSHLSYMPTKRGTRLLTSGWWGLARKINYTGDYMMGLSYSLLCGFESIVPYYYALYFLILLVHRSIRDDELCREKYGAEDWNEYKRRVPYRFIPGII